MAQPLRELFVEFFAQFDFEGFDEANRQTDELKNNLNATGGALGKAGGAVAAAEGGFGGLLTTLGLNSAAVAGLTSAFGAIQAAMSAILVVVGAVIAIIVALGATFYYLVSVIRDTISTLVDFSFEMAETGTSLSTLAQRIGTTVTALQGFRQAAIEAGSEASAMDSALTDLGEKIGDALQNRTSETARTFRRLGIELRDAEGNIRPVEDVFLEVADAIANTSDAAVRIRLANQLMGESGRQLIPLFQQGSDVIRAYRDSIAETQPELEEYVRNARRLTVEQARLDLAWEGTKQILFNALAPAIIYIIQQLVELNEWFNRNRALVDALKVAFITFAIGVVALTVFIGALIGIVVALLTFALLPLALTVETLALVFGLFLVQVAAVVLAIQDFYTFLIGGNSVFEMWLNHLYEVSNGAIPQLIDSFIGAESFLGRLLDTVSEAINEFVTFYNVIARFRGLEQINPVDFRGDLTAALSDATTADTREGFVEGIRSGIGNAIGITSDFTAEERAARTAAREADRSSFRLLPAGALPLVPTSTVSAVDARRAARGGPTSVTQNMTVNIDGSTLTPEEIESTMERLLTRQNRDVSDIFAPGEE